MIIKFEIIFNNKFTFGLATQSSGLAFSSYPDFSHMIQQACFLLMLETTLGARGFSCSFSWVPVEHLQLPEMYRPTIGPEASSLRTADIFPVVAFLPPEREATTGNTSAVRRLRSISPQTSHARKKPLVPRVARNYKKYVPFPTATVSNCQLFSLVNIEETVCNRNKYHSLLSLLLLLAPRSGLELNDSVGHFN